MRTFSAALVLAALAFSATAQQQPPASKPAAEPRQTAPQDSKARTRVRADGAAGGTAPVPEEVRKAVGAGAGPHKQDNLPSPAKLPKDQPVDPK